MRFLKISLLLSVLCLLPSSIIAADFYWLDDLNREADRDKLGYASRLSQRFQIGKDRISSLLNNVEKPADAYVILRLAEMCQKSPEYVLEEYKSNRGKGWGVLAQRLGIKPGSKEFHELKKGHDLHERGAGKGKKKQHGKEG